MASARIAELTTEDIEDEAAASTYAEDTPTPRLVVIATNADTVSAASNESEDEGAGCGDCADDDDDDHNDETLPSEASRTEAADSGVMVDDGSSTAATTPDDSMANVFSPKKQPAASMTSAILDRKQSLQSSTKSSALVK